MIGHSRALKLFLACATVRCFLLCLQKPRVVGVRWSSWLLMASFIFCFLQEICTSSATGKEGSRGKSILGFPLPVCVGSWAGLSIKKKKSSWPPNFSVNSLVTLLSHSSETVTLLIAWHKWILKLRRTYLHFFSECKKITATQCEEWCVWICRDDGFLPAKLDPTSYLILVCFSFPFSWS